ncbi:hypothetical protein CYCD_26750 [Tenuifilaceae bacterium CYCD]|nr:hypothetical protein CYCD_26750 [Tenuifilaceae bacterium CYCD]
MSKIRLTTGLLEADMKQIFPPAMQKSENLKANSLVELKQVAPELKLSTLQPFRTWDDYTETELIHLRKNEKAIYISLYMLKYGFPPQKF